MSRTPKLFPAEQSGFAEVTVRPRKRPSPALLAQTDLSGAVVSFDAGHANHDTARAIVAASGEYLIQLKSNVPAVHAAAADALQGTPLFFYDDCAHGPRRAPRSDAHDGHPDATRLSSSRDRRGPENEFTGKKTASPPAKPAFSSPPQNAPRPLPGSGSAAAAFIFKCEGACGSRSCLPAFLAGP